MSKPESAENFKHATTDSSPSAHEHAGSRMRDEAHHSMNLKHHDQHAAGKSEPTHLDMNNIFEQTAKTVTKATGEAANAVGRGLTEGLKDTGEEANHLWNKMDDSAAGHFYKHEVCGDDIVRGVLTAPAAVGAAVGVGLLGGFIATESAIPILATGAFVGAMGALGAVADYGNWHNSNNNNNNNNTKANTKTGG